MIRYLLQEMEKSPGPLFSKKELVSVSASEFERLADLKVLTYFRPAETELERVRLWCQHGCPLTVIEVDGDLEAVCLDHPEEDPIPIEQDDLSRYAFSVDAFLARLRTANKIGGDLHRIEGGYFYLGHKLYDSGRVGLAFIPQIGDGDLVKLSGLKRLCADADLLIVLTPVSAIGDVALKQALRHDNIIQASLAEILDPQTFELSITELISGLLKPRDGKEPLVTELTAQQREDYDRYEYQCYDKVYVPGMIPKKRSNVVLLNGNDVKLGDWLFALFLRFVVELRKGDGGWIDIYALKEEGLISDVGRYQAYSNLRAALQGGLLDRDGLKFIESDGSKNYRISTHPDFVTYDKEKLTGHPDPGVVELAEGLPW